LSEPAKTIELQVADKLDCQIAQSTARKFAQAVGFEETPSEEIVIAVAELASNLIRHAGSGTLTFRIVQANGQSGLDIESQDKGPGIYDIDGSMADGFSTAGGLGLGLGTVNRLMDDLEINSTPHLGTRIACRRWLREQPPDRTYKWEVGVATRARNYAPANGDAFIVKEWGNTLLAGVIDGLGHGEHAQDAALTAQRYVMGHYDRPLEDIFAGVTRACRSTRGVVMALAKFETPTQMSFSNFGNIEVKAWSGTTRLQFHVQRGILGIEARKANVQQLTWAPGWLLAMHSDGVRSNWQWSDLSSFNREPAQVTAHRILHDFGKMDDDATVVLIRS
jgi:anti-sigma regulatory factor (Ser/Thr protein kinase)